MISTDDDDDDDESCDDSEADGVSTLITSLSSTLLGFDVVVDTIGANILPVAPFADANGEENNLSLAFVVVAGIGVNLNVTVGASTVMDLSIASLIFLFSTIGAFGAGNDVVGNLISELFNFNCTFGKSTGSGSVSIFPAFRCFEMILFRILLTCLWLADVDDLWLLLVASKSVLVTGSGNL